MRIFDNPHRTREFTMNTGLQPADSSANLMITMLDGALGAVSDPTNVAVVARDETTCWCGCVVCFAPPTDGLAARLDI